MNEKTRELDDELQRRRRTGKVTLHFAARTYYRSNHRRLLNEFVSEVGFTQIYGWREVEEPQALRLIRNILHHDMAYGGRIMAAGSADSLAHRFVALFNAVDNADAMRYFTNGSWEKDRLKEWTPITDATFDAGIVGFNSTLCGLLWAQDED